MPIPHLQHKIHSPNDWESRRPSKVWGSPGRSSHGRGQRFLDVRFKKQSKTVNWLKLFKKTAPYLGILFLIGAITLLGLFAWFSRDLPDPQKLMERSVAQSTKIYDRSGEHLLYDIHGTQRRTLIQLKEIPAYAVQATLALEDQRFYEHGGFSILGMIRGVILQTLKGQRAQGGSTLTQQLIKNAVLTNERSVARKIKELILAYRIEKKYSKEEILQMYFNEIPYGSTAYGIEAAAWAYFGRSARELTLSEAALLAALPKAPSYLSPYGSHTDELFGRQKYALEQMVKLGFITKEQAQTAEQEKLTFKNRIEGIEAPHFVFFVKELLAEKYGDKLIEQGGWKIISTLDYDLQKKAEAIVKEQVEQNLKNFNAGNAAVVALEVNTGQILAMVGSKDFFDETIDGQVNVAISPRQPGSSFKPIVYTAAFNRGYVPETVVYDLVTKFTTPQGDYEPHNYDDKEHGPVSLRQALAGSLNIPAVKMIYLTGIDNVLNLADELEYTTLHDRSRFGLSLVLGGGEVKLLEHVNAYATLAREGRKIKYSAVLKLEDSSGKALEEFKDPREQKILEPAIARITTDILSDNSARAFIFGESNYLTLPDRPVAAKTGTTNDYHDAWTIGYTPKIAVGVWVGNSDNTEMKRGADGSQIAAPIWQKVMKEAVKDLPAESFVKPTYAIPNKPMLGGEASGVKIKIDKLTGLLATEATPENLVEEKIFKQAHDILHYVNKDEPLGPAPQDPAADPYYRSWEEPVAKWAEKNHLINEIPPTEFDNLHRAADRPAVTFITPQNNDNINDGLLKVTLEVRANRDIKKVEYYLDDNLLTIGYQKPFNAQLNVGKALNGEHSLTAKAYDDLENVGESRLTIQLNHPVYLNISWLEPGGGTTLKATDFPKNLILNLSDPTKVKKVDFFFKNPTDKNSTWLGVIENPKNKNLQLAWASPPPLGTYKLYPLISDVDNEIIKGPEITVSIE